MRTSPRAYTPPPWEEIPELAPARPHLEAIAEQARRGSFDADTVDALLSDLVRELHAVHRARDLERALAAASRVLATLDHEALQQSSTGYGYDRPMGTTIAAIIARRDPAATPARRTSVDPQSELTAETYRPAPAPADPPPVEARKEREWTPPPAPNRFEPSARTRIGSLDGRALQKSIVPTWLSMVVFSWLSLIWGGLISAPIGVGAVVLGGAFAGVIAVPLWATIFGFLGMNRAREATLREMGFESCGGAHPLTKVAERYAAMLSIPVPEIGIIEKFNAFAMGADRNNATVAMGRPLLDVLTWDEAEAVLAHELGHVVSGDMKSMMLMRTFQNATVWFMFAQGIKQFARWAISWGAELYILSLSRSREYWADAIAAALTSKEAMIGALRKLANAPALSDAENTHARFMIRGRFAGVFSTHPSFEERIEALEQETYLCQLPRQRA